MYNLNKNKSSRGFYAMSKISKIRELVVIFCVLVLMKGIVSYAASERALLYSDQASVSTKNITVTNCDVSVWGSVSSGSKYEVGFYVPDGVLPPALDKTIAVGGALPSTVVGVYDVTSTGLTLEANPNGTPKKECIASGGIAD